MTNRRQKKGGLRKKLKVAEEGLKTVIDEPPRKDCFSTLPVEILAEILGSQALSPKEVLALARCSRYFCDTLVRNLRSGFIWKTARQNVESGPVPDPTPNFTEPAYAAYIFDGGNCEKCGKYTDKPYASFALRLRLCSQDCKKKWVLSYSMKQEELNRIDAESDGPKLATWLLYSEVQLANGILFSMGEVMMARSEWDSCQTEEERAAYHQRTQVKAAHRTSTLDLCRAIQVWLNDRRRFINTLTDKNNRSTRQFAQTEGWEYSYLILCPSYLALANEKERTLKSLSTEQDLQPLKGRLQEELHALYQKLSESAKERVYQDHLKALSNWYHGLRARPLLMDGKLVVLPTLRTMLTLPMVKALHTKDSGMSVDIAKELAVEDSPILGILMANLLAWQERARADFAALLGHPSFVMNAKKLHPVERLTARFKCTRCKRVGMKRKENECLTFREACAHQCKDASGKVMKEEWSHKNFVPDEKAVAAVRQFFRLNSFQEDDPQTLKLDEKRVSIICLSCPSRRILMRFCDLIGHCHRHESMEFVLLKGSIPLKPQCQVPFGLVAKLTGKQWSAPRDGKLIQVLCKHCVESAAPTPLEGMQEFDKDRKDIPRIRWNRRYEFNALRSHLKSKHGIEHIRDEDICQTRDSQT